MNFDLNCDLKYKLMSADDIVLSLDRLTRFKNPEIKYRRVFYDVILKNLSYPSVSKHKLDELPASFLVRVVQEIWNESVDSLYKNCDCPFTLKDLDSIQYAISDEYTLALMNADLKIAPIIKYGLSIENENLPLNLRFLNLLLKANSDITNLKTVSEKIRSDYYTLFPIKKIILAEGITEEILLPQFSKVLGHDLKKEGVYLFATGGKSKILSIYAEFKYIMKIPMFVLLDNDAEPVYNDVVSVLRPQDKAYLIKSGEFEDILPKHIIQKAFSEMNYDVIPAQIQELSCEEGTCKSLETLWKSRGLGEFRKAHLAKAVKKVIISKDDVSEEIKTIVDLIANL